MTISGGVSINGLIQGLPQGQDVFAQMTIPASANAQPAYVSTVNTTATSFVSANAAGGVLIIPPTTLGSTTSLSFCSSGGTAGPSIYINSSTQLPSVLAVPTSASTTTIYLIAVGAALPGVQVIYF